MMKLVGRFLLLTAVLASAFVGAAVGQIWLEERKVEQSLGGALCTFYPVLGNNRDYKVKYQHQKNGHLYWHLGDPNFSEEWLKRYKISLAGHGIQPVQLGKNIGIPCRYFDDLDYLMNVTSKAEHDEWMKREGWPD